jgi:FkbM family methyltransferase
MQQVNFRTDGTDVVLLTHDQPDHLHDVLTQQKNFYELDLLRKVQSVYKEGTYIVDVGDNMGNHTIFFSKIIGARVIAFEPFAKSRKILLRNIEANRCGTSVDVHAYASGAASGTGKAMIGNDGNYGAVSIRIAPDGDLPDSKLDDFITPAMRIGVIKIDVEGGELGVLHGAVETLKRCKPHIFVEAQEEAERDEIVSFLGELGYTVRARYCWTPTYHFCVKRSFLQRFCARIW